MKIDKKYLEEVAQYYRSEADTKIKALGDNPDQNEVMAINQNGATQALKNIAYLMALGPKKQFKLGITYGIGWRAGITKPTIQARKEERRKKNKAARISRKNNR